MPFFALFAGFVASFGAALAAGAAFTTAFATAFAITALSVVSQALVKKPQIPDLGKRKQFTRLSTPTRRVIYGRTMLAPSIFHIERQTTPNDRIIIACAIADHDIDLLHSIYINGYDFVFSAEIDILNNTNPPNGVRTVTIPKTDLGGGLREELAEQAREANLPFLMKVVLMPNAIDANSSEKDFGEQMQAAGIRAFENYWVSWSNWNMKGYGMSWIVFELPTHDSLSKPKPWGAIPNIQIQVSRTIKDLERIPGTSYVPEQITPAQALYDYAKKYTGYGGTCFGEDLIDVESFVATHNRCLNPHELINDDGFAVPPYSYSCNGSIELDTSPDAVMEQFEMAAVNAKVCDVGGKLHFFHNSNDIDVGTATHFDTNDIIGNWKVLPFRPREKRRNSVSIEYARRIHSRDLIETYSVDNGSVGVSNDEKLTLTSTFINNTNQAHDAATYALLREHDNYLMEVVVGARGLSVLPNELITFTIEQLGLVAKPFRVLSMEVQRMGYIKLYLLEEPNEALDINVQGTAHFPPLYPNYQDSGKLRYSSGDGDGESGEVSVGNDGRIRLILQEGDD